MLRAVVRGRVVSSLVHLSPPPPQSRVGVVFPVAPSRPSGFDVRGRFGIGVLRSIMTECSRALSSSAGESHTYSAVQVEDVLKTMDGRLLKIESDAAESLQNLVKMEQVIKSLNEEILREMKTKAVAANEILENQQNQERLLRMKTEKRKKLLSALGATNTIFTIIFLVGLSAYFWSL